MSEPGAEEVIESAMDREERAVAAIEKIATALLSLATLAARVVSHEWPVRTVARETTVTRLPNDLDRLKASLGSTGEATTEEWMQLGPRERELIEKSRESSKAKPETPKDGSS